MVTTTASSNGMETGLVDLAHETLLRNNRKNEPFWPTLRDEVTKKRKSLENRDLAEALAKNWRENGSPRWDGLATRAQRSAFRQVRDLSNDAEAYVKASVLLVKRLMWSLVIVALLLVSTFSFYRWAKSLNIDLAYAVWLLPKRGSQLLLARIGIHKFSSEMKLLSPLEFKMGDIWDRRNDSEELPHNVTIQRGVAIGYYEVTYYEYDEFALATGRALPGDNGWGRGPRPVTNVTWENARDYAVWLSKRTGKRYRLPSEAEWEFAARSGGKNDMWAGTSDEKKLADYAVFGALESEPVGSRKPNGLGLYDMSGNVSEWVEDCWHPNYNDAPSDGRAWKEENGGQCGQRVVRGGSWIDVPMFMVSSFRNRIPADIRDFKSLGFRLAQDIE